MSTDTTTEDRAILRSVADAQYSPPPATAAGTARWAATFLDRLAPEAELSANITAGAISVQIPVRLGELPARRAILYVAAQLLATPVTTQPYANPDIDNWGSQHAAADWCGVRVDVWTALTRAEARAAGLATCAACGHADHDADTTCLAAGWDADGNERACECGPPETAPVEPPAAAYAPDWRQQLRDDEAWEARRDAARDAWAERCQDAEDVAVQA